MAPGCLAAALVVLAVPVEATPIRGLTNAAGVARLYDTILNADFEALPVSLAATCPPAPPEVCRVLQAVGVWWRIQLDPASRALDPTFRDQVNAAISAGEAWVAREPEHAEAWFYLAGAYGARAQWRVLRVERLAAARDGKRIKDALERALALDPDMADAWFGIGLYRYYADIAPTALKMLRWLLFLPGGDRVEGLQQMARAREQGQLVRGEADYQLHVIDLWYEKRFDEALDLLRGLRARYPASPLFPQLIAEVEDVYFHDATASLRSWRGLLVSAEQNQVHEPALAVVRARIGIAAQLDRLYETDRAIEQLQVVVASAPRAPYGALAEADLRLGLALARMGDRAASVAALRQALAATPPDDPGRVKDRARAALRQPIDAQAAEAHRLSIAGWRAVERHALDEAAPALALALALRPADPVTLWRRARLFAARRDEGAALADYERVILARTATPPTFLASAFLEAARLRDRRGDHARALQYFRAARDTWGADQQTKDAAARALLRRTKSNSR